MIKKICLLLVFCTVFSFLAFPIASYGKEIENGSNSVSINLMTPADFCVELEEKGIDIENSKEYEICLLIETKEDPSVDPQNFLASNVTADAGEEIDAALLRHREMVKEYYSCRNQYVADKLFLNEFDYYISFYAPYIEVVFDDVYEYVQYNETIINKIMCNQALVVSLNNYAVLEQKSFDNATINSTSTTAYPFDNALDDIGVENFGFSGAGIKVGVIESGYPDNTINLKEGLYTFIGNKQTFHSMGVTSIIGGKSGIAEDVHFYCLALGTSFTNDCNTLINTYNVDIINICYYFNVCGYYTKRDAYIDRLISNSGCTFVVSAGNKDASPNSLICVPGSSLNAITVGSIDPNKNISSFSCWLATNEFLLKPDIVAPGGNISGIDNIDDPFSGTSASTPMVTGVIALLMEEFPILKTNPALVKSVLHIGAEPLPSQTNYFDQQAGFGLINYQNMRNCLLNSNYSNFTISTNTRADDIVLSKYISVPYLDTLKINANTIVNSSVTETNTTSATPSYTDYLILIYDTAADAYVECSLVDSSVDYLVFTNTNPNNTSYIIDVIAAENSDSIATEYGSLAYEIVEHDHSFTDRYVWQSYLRMRQIFYCISRCVARRFPCSRRLCNLFALSRASIYGHSAKYPCPFASYR